METQAFLIFARITYTDLLPILIDFGELFDERLHFKVSIDLRFIAFVNNV